MNPIGMLTLVVLSPLMVPAIVGALLARGNFVGWCALVVLLAAAYVGWRVYYDARFGRWSRRAALAAAVLATFTLAASGVFVAGERAFLSWQKDMEAGFGIQPGMTLDEAKSRVEARAVVTGMEEASFVVAPTGLAAMHMGFMNQYLVFVSTDSAGRVAEVRGVSD